MEQLRCVLFDLDGTLIDTTELIIRSFHHAIGDVLGETITIEEIRSRFGETLVDSFEALARSRRPELTPAEHRDLVDRLVRTYQAFNWAHHDEIARPFPSVTETLATLSQRGFALGIVTSKGRRMAERGIDLIGVNAYLKTRVFLEDTERHKPYPDPLLLGLAQLGQGRDPILPAAALYVGDTKLDIQAGRAAGMRTAGAVWGSTGELLAKAEPDYLLVKIEDILLLCGR